MDLLNRYGDLTRFADDVSSAPRDEGTVTIVDHQPRNQDFPNADD